MKDWTPEQRAAAVEKTKATKAARKAERLARANEEEVLPQEIVYGDPPAPEREGQPIDMDYTVDPFELFLISLGPETREMIGDDELKEIYAAQVAKAFAEKKAAKKKAASEVAAYAARMEAGLVPAATREAMEVAKANAKLERVTVEMPPAGDQGEVSDIGLRIDQKVYLHGHTYTLTHAQAASFREILYRTGEMELLFKGQNRRQRQWIMGRTIGSVDRHVPLDEDGSLA
jgi:hypothetical protein